MAEVYKIKHCKVPVDFNAMIRRLKTKYPYLTGWYDSDASAASILGYEIEEPDRYLESLSLGKEENPFGDWDLDIIDCNKCMVNMKKYKYAGELRVKFKDKVYGWEKTIEEMENHLENMMKIIEEKRLELKMQAIQERKNELEQDFEK